MTIQGLALSYNARLAAALVGFVDDGSYSHRMREKGTIMTINDLIKIAEDRELWAKEAHERDLHGSAREWELTAALARELISVRQLYGSTADSE
jgi:hypothetical protein